MAKKLCKRCDSKMDSITMESNDEHGFHEHYNCRKDPRHPTYCVTEKIWIGK
jgi:hypothetical protein